MEMSNTLESEVRYYCRVFPDVFVKAEGSHIYSESGRAFLDFFSGAGSLNYGHNNPSIHKAVMYYLKENGIICALDMNTEVKLKFMNEFNETILGPRGLECKFQFPGPTGTNAIEAAIKLSRKITGRKNIFAFFGSFHGMTLGSLSATSSLRYREASGATLHDVTFMPFPEGFMSTFDTIKYMEEVLTDSHSGIEKPAAVLLETVQAEGGVNAAPFEWLVKLRDLCTRHEIIMICDDIQVGCGRTGKFFSFEHSGIKPDIIALSKSISGLGLPLSMLLIRKDLDAWSPGDHSGTFRSNALSLTGALAALEIWKDPGFEKSIGKKSEKVESFLSESFKSMSPRVEIRGLGMIRGVSISGNDGPEIAAKIASRCYDNGLILERAGRRSEVVKLLPSLIIDDDDLYRGLNIIKQAVIEFA
ncbi:MAG TPA: diaminobutyrate--2-oxoglutarate transaminase [bacterium]|nr:diaminobutyrate--2-oxoglutarate transaminase [bacterium]